MTAELRALGDRHGIGKGLAPGGRTREQPVPSPDHHGLDCALGRIVVDSDAAVVQYNLKEGRRLRA